MSDVLCCYFDILVMIYAVVVLIAQVIIERDENQKHHKKLQLQQILNNGEIGNLFTPCACHA